MFNTLRCVQESPQNDNMVSKKLKEELKKFRDKLEKLDSNQDKIVFLRNFVINKKNNES